MPTLQLELLPDYFQFYLQDEAASGDLSQAWSPAAVTCMLAMAEGVVGLGTARNMLVPVTVEVLEMAPPALLERFDHVVEGSLEVSSGTLVIAGCTDYLPDAARLPIAKGGNAARVCVSGLDTLSEDGLQGQDHYLVQLWPCPLDVLLLEPRVLKQSCY